MNADDLKLFKAKANGRLDGSEEILTGRVQNLLTHVSSSQRSAGYFDYYKMWWQIADDDDGVGVDPEMYLDFPTLGDDFIVLFSIDDRVAIEDISGYSTGNDTETKYGTAYLDSNIIIGDLTFDVVVKNEDMATGSDAIFRDGDTIKITDKTSDTATSGNEEIHTLNGVPIVASDGITITLTISDASGFANNYTADNIIRVRSVFENSSDLETSIESFTVTTTGDGDYDDSSYPLLLDNIGTVDEDWTITFTDASSFRLDGDSLGNNISTGNTASNFSPNNSDRSRPYFTIYSSGFSGTFTSGDTITFTTKPAAKGLGLKRVIPPGTGSLANNKIGAVLVVEGG